jgi:hypothetical protein
VWDTINTLNGTSFGVMVADKTTNNLYFGLGSSLTFFIDGTESKELSLVRGFTYNFSIFSPGHPWHISTDYIGGDTHDLVTDGQINAPNDYGTVTFSPNSNHPSLLHYVCGNHQYMGNNINIVAGDSTQNLGNLHTGTYTAQVADAAGCVIYTSFLIGANSCTVTLNLKAYIQALYIGGGMMQPTLYTTGVSSEFNATDSITVELHNAAYPYTGIATASAVLHSDGLAQLAFPGAVIGGNYYIVVRNRNAVETWSKLPVLFDSGELNFDFTTY